MDSIIFWRDYWSKKLETEVGKTAFWNEKADYVKEKENSVILVFVSQEKNSKEIAGKSELYQNYPNPFYQRTVIGINLANAGRGSFKITDVTGRLIKVIEKDWTGGYHEIWIDRREIQASGVLYYSFEGLHPGANAQGRTTFRAVKKMVIVE